MVGFEPTVSGSRNRRNTRLSYILLLQSAQRELNPHFRHGKAAGCRYNLRSVPAWANVVCRIVKEPLSGSPESRTQRHPVISRVWATGPRLPTGLSPCIFSTQLTPGSCAHLSRSGSGGARIRVPWFSARCYTISATDPTKKARCPYDTGLSVFLGNVRPGVTNAMDNRRADSPDDRRTVLSTIHRFVILSLNIELSFPSDCCLSLEPLRCRKVSKDSQEFSAL